MSETQVNIHPADELASIREEIKFLEKREAELRAHFLSEGLSRDDFEGVTCTVSVLTSSRETIDKAALIAEFGVEAVQPFLKKSAVRTVRVASR